ncbi:MAG: hypothetical protein U9Q68_01320 [Euryarchaeota archaeon]|nr:hypothetical protein [Euryarchaeota archaeon]
MIPSNIEKRHVIDAMRKIDSDEFPSGRGSKKFLLDFEGRRYPPKYVISLANKFASGEELNPSIFNGGQETNGFLKRLGFDIVEVFPSGQPTTPPDKPVVSPQNEHNERCLDCKNVFEIMLKKIYGDVKPNYKFNIGTNPENFRDTPYYEDLKRIFTNLQNYRGYKDFVYTDTLPNCDYFVPNPGFVVEFDESQHFTIPRKISLLSYPYKSESGFSLGRWAFTCDKTRATDNDPYYRDEQRAWYDALRDFLPELTGNLKPTVRIYSKEIQWCSLNPDNSDDVAKFKNIIEGRRKDLNGWVATVIRQSDSDSDYSNDDRMEELLAIVDHLATKTSGDGVILFPGGWFYTDEKEPCTIYKSVEQQLKDILREVEENIIVCIGIDGGSVGYLFSWDNVPGAGSKGLLEYLTNDYGIGWATDAEIRKSNGDKTIQISKDGNSAEITIDEGEKATLKISGGDACDLQAKEEDGKLNIHIKGNYAKDQIGLAVDKDGIKAISRKFHPAPQERGHVELAEDYSSKEGGKSSIFELNGVKYFMCVCYDTYGIRHLDLHNPGVDVVLNLVHCFYPKGKGPSGDPYFARHGFAGASKQWRCPVFGTAVFFNRDIPEKWPTGVYWNRGDISTRDWSYSYNPIKHEDKFKIDIKDGLIRIYDLETMAGVALHNRV